MIVQSQPLEIFTPVPNSASSSRRSMFSNERARTRFWCAMAIAVVHFLEYSISPWISEPGASWGQHQFAALRTTVIHTTVWWACMLVADAASPTRAPQKFAYILACLAAAAISIAIWRFPTIAQLVRDRGLPNELANALWQVALYTLWSITLATVAYYHLLYGQSEHSALQELRLDRARVVREATEAQLQSMQARVNPRLLFSTLQEVEHQCDADPATADHILGCLIAFLRASTPATAETTLTLATELAVAQTYLDLAAARHRPRLTYTIDVSASIRRTLRMPAMLLLPLVEYASAVALQYQGPASLALAVDIDSRRQLLVVTALLTGVAQNDECAGMMQTLHDRLHELYGSAAAISRIDAPPGMTKLAMEIPDERTERGDC